MGPAARGNPALEPRPRDREQDPSSRTERLALDSAQALAEAGKFAKAALATLR